MEAGWKNTIHRQRTELANMLHEPLTRLAQVCALAGDEREQLNRLLLEGFASIPYCTSLYVLDARGVQLSDNIGPDGIVAGHQGRDRSQRPYMREPMPPWGFLLSDAYISLLGQRPSLTALHCIWRDGEVRGYLGADFDLRDLPASPAESTEPLGWRQIRGDPSIRETVFLQSRVESPMDRNITQAMSILEELATERGMFQTVIHFSSSRTTAWFLDDPYRYRILDHEALADPDICLAWPHQPYPQDALIPRESIRDILAGMRELRLADQNIYLRSASMNIFNGMISLTFSCDGSHYMGWNEFLDRGSAFWRGVGAS